MCVQVRRWVARAVVSHDGTRANALTHACLQVYYRYWKYMNNNTHKRKSCIIGGKVSRERADLRLLFAWRSKATRGHWLHSVNPKGS